MFMFQHKTIGSRLWTRKTDNVSLISRQICISREGCSSNGQALGLLLEVTSSSLTNIKATEGLHGR
jgi:hypothetical protein